MELADDGQEVGGSAHAEVSEVPHDVTGSHGGVPAFDQVQVHLGHGGPRSSRSPARTDDELHPLREVPRRTCPGAHAGERQPSTVSDISASARTDPRVPR
jgi:hypothetical protein